jgi:hypothetical protein
MEVSSPAAHLVEQVRRGFLHFHTTLREHVDMRLLLERSVVEIAGKLGVASSRLYNAVDLLRLASVYRFRMGRDVEKNAETLATFVRQRLAAGTPAAVL